jgi:hypothetical protein
MTHSATATSYSTAAAGTRANPVKIAALDTSITPRTAASKILVSFGLSCEAPTDSVFYLIRRVGGTPTEIGSATGNGSSGYGFMPMPFDNDQLTTQANIFRSYLDSPNTASAVTYELWWYTTGAAARTLYLNRSTTDGGGADTERTTSQCILQEYFA